MQSLVGFSFSFSLLVLVLGGYKHGRGTFSRKRTGVERWGTHVLTYVLSCREVGRQGPPSVLWSKIVCLSGSSVIWRIARIEDVYVVDMSRKSSCKNFMCDREERFYT